MRMFHCHVEALKIYTIGTAGAHQWVASIISRMMPALQLSLHFLLQWKWNMTCCSDAVRYDIFFQLDLHWIHLQESWSTKHIFIDCSNTFVKSHFLSYISAQKIAAKLISNYHYLRLKCVLSDTNLCQKNNNNHQWIVVLLAKWTEPLLAKDEFFLFR